MNELVSTLRRFDQLQISDDTERVLIACRRRPWTVDWDSEVGSQGSFAQAYADILT